MDNLPTGMTAADIAVILVFLVAGAWGYSKGLVHSILYIGAWVGAVLATVYGYGYAQPYANELIRIAIVADIATASTLFLVSLIALLLLIRTISKKVQDSALGIFDRALGFGFGLLAATVILSLAYTATNWVWPEDEQPEWLANARTLPLIAEAADVLASLTPEDFSFSDFGGGEETK